MTDRDLFVAALNLENLAERQAYLDEACGADSAARERVAALLKVYENAGSFLESPPASPTSLMPSSVPTELSGAVIGPYKLLQPIGEGGMGTVYMAEQTRPVRRTVALKLIRAGMDSRQVLARFGAERQALALMDHPNIAKVFDAGTTDTGRPYFVMELVKGIPITRFCDERRLTLRERLELAIPVCQAVQHAHQKGVIHRDLKPSNVLIALYDGKAVPKVIDFGVAKATGPWLTDQTLYTEFGAVVGTLEYMSPEQAELNQLDIDTRSDIYSLGVLLYELLTGSTPLERKRVKEGLFLEVLRVIREEESPRPSLRLSTTDQLPSIAACRHVEPRRLSGLVRGELDWIVMKALEKDRDRRYETANGLAADLRRYLDDDPVHACPPSAGYRLRKLIRRNKAVITTMLLVAAALVVGTIVSTLQAIRARDAEWLAENRLGAENRARGRADAALLEEATQRGIAEGSRRSLQSTLADMYTAQGLMSAERDHPDQAVLWFATGARVAPSDADRSRYNATRARTWGRTVSQPVAAFEVNGGPRLRSLAFHPREPHLLAVDSSSKCTLWDVMSDEAIRLPGEPGTATSAAWSPGGKWLAIGRKSGDVDVFEYPRWDRVTRIAHRGSICAVSFNRNGTYLAIASDVVRVWDCRDQMFVTPELIHPQPVDFLLFNALSDRIVTTCRDLNARVFAIDRDAPSDQPLFDPVPHYSNFDAPDGDAGIGGQLIAPAYADHDKALITIGVKTPSLRDHRQVVWRDAATGRVIRILGDDKVVLFLGSEHRIFLGGHLRHSQIIDAVTAQKVGPTLQHTHSILTAAFSADERWLLTGGEDGISRLWSVADGKLLDQRGLHGVLSNVALSPDGRFQATATGGLIRVWINPSGGLEKFRTPIEGATSLAVFSPDGRHVLPTGGRTWTCTMSTTRVYEVATGQTSGPPLRPGGVILSAAFAPDGRQLVLASSQRTVMSTPPQRWGERRITRWDWQSGRMIGPPTVISDDPWEVCYSPDGKLIAARTALSHLILMESATGKVLRDEDSGLGRGSVSMWGKLGTRVGFRPDGQRILLWGGGADVSTWDPTTDGPREVLTLSGWAEDLAFSPDGRQIIKGTAISDADSGKRITDIPEHPDGIFANRFSPDGTRVLTGCRDGAARLWDWRSGQLICPPLHHAHEMWDVGFTPDGQFLATASIDGTARVWESLTGRPLTPPLLVGGMAWSLAISRDGRWLAVGGAGLRYPGIPVFDLQDLSHDSSMTAEELQGWAELVACQRIHETGNVENLSGAEWLTRWKAYRHLRTMQPTIDWSPESQAEWHDRRALASESTHDWQAALWHLDRWLERRPRNPEFLRRRGRAHLGLGQTEKAIADLTVAIVLDPSDEQAWSWRGAAELESGKLEEAIADLSKALQLAPEDWLALTNRGIARGLKAPSQSAVDDLSQAMRICPENLRALQARMQLYQALGQGKKVLADFEHAVEIGPDQPDPNNNLAWFLATSLDASLRDPKRAVGLAKKAVDLAPKEGTLWNTLGVAQYRNGEWKLAIEALTKAMELRHGGDANDWFLLAMSHWRLGDKAQARSWYDRAVASMEKSKPVDEELLRFRAEAAALLEVNETKR
jgi:serine/threonine protein kinase/WD40 repeat protein/tetratricopeptide (TPR) repeat protein